MVRPTACALVLLLLSAAPSDAETTIRDIAESGRHPHSIRPDFGSLAPEMIEAYEVVGYEPLWLTDGRPTTQANEVIDALLAASGNGLLPADYDAGWLDSERRRLIGAPEMSASFDTGLTLSVMRFVAESYRGRVDPRSAGFDVDSPPKQLDLSGISIEVARSDAPAQRLAAYEPPFAVYGSLKAGLERMRRLAAGGDLPEIPNLPKLRPGDRDAGAPALRAYLTILGYLDSRAAAPEDPELYDSSLAEAVPRFQARHGLGGDAVIGRQTLRQLQVPLTHRVKQIEWAMERLRWLPYEFNQRFIVVNIPEFRLRGYTARDKAPDVAMNVVVGSAGKTRTPVLYAEMEYVIFRPYWNVPRDISSKELLPSIRRDPTYLKRNEYQIVAKLDGRNQVLDATAESIDLLAQGGARLRQTPGRGNALGLVKFIFPNPQNVYMHDTPSKGLFKRSRRDFSHGCIRVEDPVALALFVLGDEEWNGKRVRDAMNARQNRRVDLPGPVQVLLYYTTAVVEADGEVYFFDDIYGHDAKLADLLAREELP